MRPYWLILLLCPLVIAQVEPAPGNLAITEGRLPDELHPKASRSAFVAFEYSCEGIDGVDDLTLYYEVNATRRSDRSTIPLDGTGSVILDSRDCLLDQQRMLEEEVEIPFTLDDFDEDDVFLLDIVAWTEAGEGQTRRISQEVLATYSAPMVAPDNSTVEEPIDAEPDERLAPGAPLGLIVTALAALAIRRQR